MGTSPDLERFNASVRPVVIIDGYCDWNGFGPYESFSIKITPQFYQGVLVWRTFIVRRLRFLESINERKKFDGMYSICPQLGTLLATHRGAFRGLGTLVLHMDKQLGTQKKEFTEYRFERHASYDLLVQDALLALRTGLLTGISKAVISPDRYRRENALRTVDNLFPSLRPTKESLALMAENIKHLKKWACWIAMQGGGKLVNLDKDLEPFRYPRLKWEFEQRWNTSLSLRCGPRMGHYDENGDFVKGPSKITTQGPNN